jgi:hypothetical protein
MSLVVGFAAGTHLNNRRQEVTIPGEVCKIPATAWQMTALQQPESGERAW